MSKKVFDVVHGNGEYKAQDGSTKTRWQNVGVVFKSEKGNYVLKLDAIPTRRNEEGELWLNLFVPQEREQKPAQPKSGGFREAHSEQVQTMSADTQDGFEESDIPF